MTVILGLSLLTGATAGEIQFYFEGDTGYPGMPIQLVLHAVDSKGIDRPVLPQVSGLSYAEGGQSRYEERSMGSGGSSRKVTTEFRWLVTPSASGIFTIPSITVEMKDGPVNTESLRLEVKKPGPVEGYHLFLKSDGTTVFPGMPVRLTLKWLFSSEVSRPDFTIPFLKRDDFSVEDLPAPSSSTSDVYKFEAEGHILYAVQSAEIYEGKQYASISISWDLYPEEPGELNLEPVYLAFQRVVKDSYGRKRYVPAVIPSDSLSLTVKELPEGVGDFSGGVLIARDNLEVEASLDQQRVYPGDPLELTLRINGLVNPGLTRFKGVDALGDGLFRAESGSLHNSEEGDDKLVVQTIRILRSGLSEFPVLEFPYYNMTNGKVETARSNALPLEVLELESTDQNTVKSQSFFQEEELAENGAIKLRANHGSSILRTPDFIYNWRWIFLFISLIPILFSQITRLPGIDFGFMRNSGVKEFHDFQDAVKDLARENGDEHAALVLIHKSGICWLNAYRSGIKVDSAEYDLPDSFEEFQIDLEELEKELWMSDTPVSAELKQRMMNWPQRMTSGNGWKRV